MKTLRQRFESLGLNLDSITAKVEGFTVSTGDKGTWYTFVANILSNGKYESFVCKLNAGSANAEHIAKTKEFFDSFKAGDYMLTNVGLRVAGEDWTDESGNKGTYKESYVNVPFISNFIYLGSDAVYNMKKQEAEYAKMALQAMKEE